MNRRGKDVRVWKSQEEVELRIMKGRGYRAALCFVHVGGNHTWDPLSSIFRTNTNYLLDKTILGLFACLRLRQCAQWQLCENIHFWDVSATHHPKPLPTIRFFFRGLEIFWTALFFLMSQWHFGCSSSSLICITAPTQQRATYAVVYAVLLFKIVSLNRPRRLW